MWLLLVLLLGLLLPRVSHADVPGGGDASCSAPPQLDADVVRQHVRSCLELRRVCWRDHVFVLFPEPDGTPQVVPAFSAWPKVANQLGTPPVIEQASRWIPRANFSRCTVPIFAYQSFIHSYGETIARGYAPLYHAQQAGGFGRDVTLAPMLYFNKKRHHAPGGYVQALYGSLTDRPLLQPAPSELQHCFERALVCGLNTRSDAPLYKPMQAVVARYLPHLPPAPQLPRDDPTVMNIVFEVNWRVERQILNLGGILKKCNALTNDQVNGELRRWPPTRKGSGTLPGKAREAFRRRQRQRRRLAAVAVAAGAASGSAAWPGVRQWRRARCVPHAFGLHGFAADVAVAQAADVLVCTHGSGCYNVLLMRPGSALLEIRPYGFAPTETNIQHMLGVLDLADVDPYAEASATPGGPGGPDVLWFGYHGANSSRCRAAPVPATLARHSILRWDVLGRLLAVIWRLGGSGSAYRSLVQLGGQYVSDEFDSVPQLSHAEWKAAIADGDCPPGGDHPWGGGSGLEMVQEVADTLAAVRARETEAQEVEAARARAEQQKAWAQLPLLRRH